MTSNPIDRPPRMQVREPRAGSRHRLRILRAGIAIDLFAPRDRAPRTVLTVVPKATP
ncbi:MAG TPA: hypothetical protein VLX92_08930 [Kofleriaceae bacterium]|nr:hypothetical protein [Kofleriaceae bacterium]